jgi:hypothetical protein
MPARHRKRQKVHSVRAKLSVQHLSKAGSSLNLQVFAEGRKIGELEIGRGSLYWWGRSRHTRKRIAWSKFAEMMDALAYGD